MGINHLRKVKECVFVRGSKKNMSDLMMFSTECLPSRFLLHHWYFWYSVNTHNPHEREEATVIMIASILQTLLSLRLHLCIRKMFELQIFRQSTRDNPYIYTAVCVCVCAHCRRQRWVMRGLWMGAAEGLGFINYSMKACGVWSKHCQWDFGQERCDGQMTSAGHPGKKSIQHIVLSDKLL